MLIRVDRDMQTGLADQIAGQVRRALSSGDIEPGDALPSAKQLAESLGVNMHTVLRAYAALREEGLIVVQRGRGARVRRDADPGRSDLRARIRALVAEADRLGMSREELIAEMEKVNDS